MRLLVTGGAGFIGSAVIKKIIRNTNHSVINVDKLTYAANLKSLEEVSDSERYIFEKVDICNFDDLSKTFVKHNPDAIIHLAAESHVDKSIKKPEDFIYTNVIGTFNLLEISKEYYSNMDLTRRSKFRFLHVSTDEVYGDLGPEDPAFTENNPYCPSSPYSATKASSDHLVRAWHRTHKLPTIITNCSNNYGPFQFPEKLIPLMIKNALNDKL